MHLTTTHRTPWRRGARIALAALGIASLGAPTVAYAQQPGTPAPAAPDPHNAPFVKGAILRITARTLGSEPVVGTVDSLRGDVVVLDTVAPRTSGGLFSGGTVPVDEYRYIAIRAGDMRQVEVREGTSKISGAWRYGMWGALIGGVVFGIGNAPQTNPSASDFVAGFVPGAITGAVIGTAYGMYSGRERWKKIDGPYYLSAPSHP